MLINVREDTKRERNELQDVQRHAKRIGIHRGWKRQGDTAQEADLDLNDYEDGKPNVVKKEDDDFELD